MAMETSTHGELDLGGRREVMSFARRAGNLAGTILPLVGLAVAIVLLWDRMVGVRELTILFVGYLLAGLGITVGYHRLFTHRSFETNRVVKVILAVLGALCGAVEFMGARSQLGGGGGMINKVDNPGHRGDILGPLV